MFGAQGLVHSNKCVPVLRLYALLPRTSLLQGIASTGANWPHSISFFGLQGVKPLFLNPTIARAPDLSTIFCFFMVCLLVSQVSSGLKRMAGLQTAKNYCSYVF